MSRNIPAMTWGQYVQDRLGGMTRTAAAKRYNISLATAARFDRGEETSSGHDIWLQQAAGRYPFSVEKAENNPDDHPAPFQRTNLLIARNYEARRALDDFDLFRRRYLGEISRPWHVRVADETRDRLAEPGRSYLLINAPPGTGKALALDTPLPTPTGWTTIKDVQVGDEVFDERGQPCRVIACSEVFYGHECFTVSTDDGASVIADAGHLWPVRLDHRWGVHAHTTTRLARPRNKRPQLALTAPLHLPDRELPLDPYVLGVWLGDGDSLGARICDPPTDAAFMRRQFAEAGFTTTDHRNPMNFGILGLSKVLRAMGVWGNKHVPDAYLRASGRQRLALLQGLIDTDGYVEPDGQVEFCSTNRRIAHAARQLIWSLGVKAGFTEGRAMLYGKDCGPKYRVHFRMAAAARLPRNAELCRDGVRTPNRYLTATPCESVPTRCIQVDSPSQLYLAGEGMIVTHNSTLIRAIGLQATVRNRAIRAARVSNVLQLARSEVRLIRRHLERASPVTQRTDLVNRGLACDAVSTLEHDYGRFKPEGRDLWSMEAFVVMQIEGGHVSEKEPTWSAYGMDSAIIGNRFDLLLGDDLDTPSTLRATDESRRARFEDWDNEVETRLEPDGLIVVLGQRLGQRDIYRYLADKRISRDDVDVLDVSANEDPRVYVHLSFPAHHMDLCTNEHHRRDALAWGEGGCLLDPYRVPWVEVAKERDHNPAKYHTVLQQEDGDPVNTLIDRVWIDGGVLNGVTFAGCWDRHRRVWQPPHNVANPVGVIQVDPSGTEHWAVQAWCYVPPLPLAGDDGVFPKQEETLGHQRILLDLFDGAMTAPDLLDWSHNTNTFHGLLEEWAQNYRRIGIPLRFVVVEINAAQRYLLQFEHARRWSRQRQCSFLAHTTGIRKLDADLGVYSLRAPYKHGLVRLPGGDPLSILACTPLVDQLVHFPGRRTDQVMAQWFGECNLATIAPTLANARQQRPWRPSWALAGARR